MNPSNLSPALQAHLERTLQAAILWTSRALLPWLLFIDWMEDKRKALTFEARMQRVHDLVMEHLADHDVKPEDFDRDPCDDERSETECTTPKCALFDSFHGGPCEFANALDDPRMDGTQWIPAQDVTQEMIASWPGLWQADRGPDFLPFVCPADRMFAPTSDLHTRTYDPGRHGAWRPLRLPGMGIDGIVQARDMTPEHWKGRKWLRARHGSDKWEPVVNEWTTVMDVDGTRFRPVNWPEKNDTTTK